MKTIILILACLFVPVQYIRGQTFNESYENSEIYEEHYRNFFSGYSDAISDTLFFNGKRYTFRTSPLSLKKGYANIFSDTIIHVMGDVNIGKKGYTLTWVIKNDSLFIRNIYRNGKVNDTNTVSKIEKFTECLYKNGLLNIHWISGDFGLLTSDRKNNLNEWYNEVEHVGYRIRLKKGKLITIENNFTVNLSSAGSLKDIPEAKNVRNLTVTGPIDIRDIHFMRDSIVAEILDLSGVIIIESSEQNRIHELIKYPANELPGGAFSRCERIKKIILPKNLASIGAFAFSGCKSLSSITLPEILTVIKRFTFSGCRSLTSIEIPEGVKELEQSAFENCASLASIKLPVNLTKVGSSAFIACKSLISIILPANVYTIEMYAFANCINLTSVEFSENLISIGNSAFYKCVSLQSVVLPNRLESIGNYAFSKCSDLKYITLPANLESIGLWAFYDNNKLEKITNLKLQPVEFEWGAFSNINENCVLKVLSSSVELYKKSIDWGKFKSIDIIY